MFAAYKMQKDSFIYLQKLMEKEGLLLNEISIPLTNKTIKPEKIVQLVEEIFNTDISAQNRKQSTIYGRQAAAYMLRLYTKLSLSEIKKYIGVNDHTTVLYSVKKCIDMIETELWYAEKIKELCSELDEYVLYLSTN